MTRLASSVRCAAICFAVAVAFTGVSQSGQSNGKVKLKLDTGKEIYEAGCASCHGSDGKGQTETTLGFNKPDTSLISLDVNRRRLKTILPGIRKSRDGGPSRGLEAHLDGYRCH